MSADPEILKIRRQICYSPTHCIFAGDDNGSGRPLGRVLLSPRKSLVDGSNIAAAKSVNMSRGGFLREDLASAKRIVVKVGTSVLTRDNEFGVSLTRLASLVEQVCALVENGHEVIIVTSGAVGFGKMRLQIQTIMSQTVRHTLSKRSGGSVLDSRACAAAGQSGLMTLYDAMFSQYGVTIAQILVTMSDFQEEAHRANMCETIKELLALGVVPVVNENDVFYSNTSSREFIMNHQNTTVTTFNPNFNGQDVPAEDANDSKVVRLTANDSLTALLAVELDAQLMVILSNVDGVYTSPPGGYNSLGEPPKLMHTYNPEDPQTEAMEYAIDQRVGRGGMAAKVDAARFALNHGVPAVICNGHQHDVLLQVWFCVDSVRVCSSFAYSCHGGETRAFFPVA